MTSSIAQSTRWLDATAQADLVAGGEVSATELVEAAIERIEEFDGPLNSVVVRWFDDARAAAADVDGRLARGEHVPPFAGVPTLLKDLWAHSVGHPMTNGNAGLKAEMPISTYDTTLVSRFRDAGLITLGRTNSPELGSLPVTEPLSFGPTRNPWSTDHTPGGSSGGAAAAVAAGLVPIANASDGGGSIRIPASCCGLIGLKPSQGRITMGPDRDESGLGVHFAVTRSMRDTAGLLDLCAGPGVGDNVIAPAPARPYIDEVGADPGSAADRAARAPSARRPTRPRVRRGRSARGSAAGGARPRGRARPTRRCWRTHPSRDASWRSGRRTCRSASRRWAR